MKEDRTCRKHANKDRWLFSKGRKVRCDAVPGNPLLYSHMAVRLSLIIVATVTLVLAVAVTAASQMDTQQRGFGLSFATEDLIALGRTCGPVKPLEEPFQLIQQHACSGTHSGAGQILAFEENRLFIYALTDMSGGRKSEGAGDSHNGVQQIRRFFLLKPSTFVVADIVRTRGAERPIHWVLRSAWEPRIEDGWIRVAEADTEIIGESLLPANASLKKTSHYGSDNQPAEYRVEVIPKQTSQETRFLQVLHLVGTAKQDAPAHSTVTEHGEQLELKVATHERVFRLTLPSQSSSAGEIDITAADGRLLLPSRLLPSGVLPHGPEGASLLELWDAPYRGDSLPGWDVGRPCSHLVKAVEDETFRPGRAIVLGCGTGDNAIYLAGKGFEVTAVDIAPTALTIAAKRAGEAGVKVDWVLADVVAMPTLEEFDLVFDRGCYHHIQKYDSAGYVETLRRLSHRGTRALILAGSPADGGRGGPPRVKEQTICNDFSALFDFEWVRVVRFDMRDASAKGQSAWSIHLRRKGELKGTSELTRSLHEFATKGDMEAVKSMIDHGADVNGREDGFKRTALHRAAMSGQKDVSKLLIDHGARLDAKDVWPGGTALDYAADKGHKDVAELLITEGANVNARRKGHPDGDTPLHSAVRAGHEDVVKLLIDKGANVHAKNNDGRSPIDVAMSQGQGEIGELVQAKAAETSIHWAAVLGSLAKVKAFIESGTDVNVKDESHQTPLHVAISNKHKDVARLLIEQGADVNAKGKRGGTPLYSAIWNGDADMIELLVSKGADVNYSPANDYPPLHYAVWMENTDIARALLDHGANCEAKDQDGKTAFRLAIDAANRQTVELFVAKGANVNAKGQDSSTPLHQAVMSGRADIAEILLVNGADVTVKDGHGRTALSWALERGHIDIVGLLRKHGAKE
ncbi:MAG: ankyrin repeat domain-containing protein [Planctomycetota bacterium]|jgi:ankyrin repeat protein